MCNLLKDFFVSISIEKVAREISCKWGGGGSLERKDANWIEGDEGERARADECSRVGGGEAREVGLGGLTTVSFYSLRIARQLKQTRHCSDQSALVTAVKNIHQKMDRNNDKQVQLFSPSYQNRIKTGVRVEDTPSLWSASRLKTGFGETALLGGPWLRVYTLLPPQTLAVTGRLPVALCSHVVLLGNLVPWLPHYLFI